MMHAFPSSSVRFELEVWNVARPCVRDILTIMIAPTLYGSIVNQNLLIHSHKLVPGPFALNRIWSKVQGFDVFLLPRKLESSDCSKIASCDPV